MKLLIGKTACLVCFLFCAFASFAQPANDNCGAPAVITVAADEASCVWTSGTTLNATQSNAGLVCSGSWFADDVWYSFTTGATVSAAGITIRTDFGSMTSDVPNIGMGVYTGCATTDFPAACFSGVYRENKVFAQPNTTYYVRVWSGSGTTTFSGTFRICAYQNEVKNDVVIWGDNPTEGQFTGGLNGWTTSGATTPNDAWTWDATGTAAPGWYANNYRFIVSPTATTGAMVYDADFKTSGGTSAPASGVIHEGELISPVINCSGVSGVTLEFYQYYRNLNGDCWMAYSTDGGITWEPEVSIYDESFGSRYLNQCNKTRVYLPNAAGSAAVQIRFRFQGDLYYWVIDDVKLLETERNNLAIGRTVVPYNYGTPSGQSYMYPVDAEVVNLGSAVQTNVSLTASIKDNMGNAVQTANTSINSLQSQEDTLLIIPGQLSSPITIGDYTLDYQITSDSTDYDLSDNNGAMPFVITDSTFQKDRGNGVSGTRSASTGDYEYGASYFVTNGDGMAASSVTFACGTAGTTMHNESVAIKLYEVVDNNDGTFDDNDVNWIGFSFVTFDSSYNEYDLYWTKILDVASGQPNVALKDSTEYFLMFATTTNLYTGVNAAIDYNFIPVRSDILKRNDNGQWFTGGFTGLNSPVVRMHIAPMVAPPVASFNHNDLGNLQVDFSDASSNSPTAWAWTFGDGNSSAVQNPTHTYTASASYNVCLTAINAGGSDQTCQTIFVSSSTVNNLAPNDIVQISPKLVAKSFNFNADLSNFSNKTLVTIISMSGQKLFSKDFGRTNRISYAIDADQFANGQYTIFFETDYGSWTDNLVISR